MQPGGKAKKQKKGKDDNWNDGKGKQWMGESILGVAIGLLACGISARKLEISKIIADFPQFY